MLLRDESIPSPRSLGLNHTEWRPSQYDAYKKALSVYEGGGGKIVIELPTGSGKSGCATALGATDSVTVLVHNHGLLDQYEKLYNFDIIKGRQEYPCILDSKVDNWKALYGMTPTMADCHFASGDMCPVSSRCPYIVARNKAFSSDRMACTYKYAALSEAIRSREGILVMDEAHDCYEEMLALSQLTMDESTRSDNRFAKFPLINFGAGGNGDILEGENRKIVLDWFVNSMSKISVVDLFSAMTPDGARNQKMFDKLMSGINMLDSNQVLFYKCSKPNEYNDWRYGRSESQLVMQIRSLDVRGLVSDITKNKQLTVFMSATIGDPKPLMNELGITDFQYHNYPHPIPKEKRPVYDLGVEPMTKKNLDDRPALYKLQANRIADFILSQDKNWRGIVLTSSNFKIEQLRRFLKDKLNGRVFEPGKFESLSEQVDNFKRDRTPGKIAVGTMQGWGSGISLDGDIARISVVAGVPYANPGDRFDQIRMSSTTGKNYLFWHSYCGVVQATGRVSRGEKNEDGSLMLNVAALADGSATSPIAKRSFPMWFNESIVRWSK
jgi:Rad3-related DNA helicase